MSYQIIGKADICVNIKGENDFKRVWGKISLYKWAGGTIIRSELSNLPADKNKYILLSDENADVEIPIHSTENGYSYMITYSDRFSPCDVEEIKIIYNSEDMPTGDTLKNGKIIAANCKKSLENTV